MSFMTVPSNENVSMQIQSLCPPNLSHPDSKRGNLKAKLQEPDMQLDRSLFQASDGGNHGQAPPDSNKGSGLKNDDNEADIDSDREEAEFQSPC